MAADLDAALAALQQSLEQATHALEASLEQTGASPILALIRALVLALDPTSPMSTYDERLLIQEAIVRLTHRLQTLEMFETFAKE